MQPLSSYILDPFWTWGSFSHWDLGIEINSEDVTSYTMQYQEVFLKYVENEYCAQHRHLCGMKPDGIQSNFVFISALASGSGQLSFDPYDVSSSDEG